MTTLGPAKEFSRTLGMNVTRNGGQVPLLYRRSLPVESLAALATDRSSPVIEEENGGRGGKWKKRAKDRLEGVRDDP
jgi:hypothetical protein